MHPFAKLLYGKLTETPVGMLIRYEQLSEVIGRDIQAEGRHHLAAARSVALRRDRIVFDVERDVGLRRADAVTTVAIGESRVTRVGRAAKRGGEIVATIDVSALDSADAVRMHVARTQLGLAQLFSSERATRDLSRAIERGGARVSIKEVVSRSLKMFVPKP